MTPPINIDGTQITGASIDGQTVSEITVDGTEVFSAIPDSAIAQYDATTLSLTNGDPVSTWPDNINGFDLTENNNPPSFVSSGINGFPSVRFDKDILTNSTSYGLTTGYTLISVSEEETEEAFSRLFNTPDRFPLFGYSDNNDVSIQANTNTLSGGTTTTGKAELLTFVVNGVNSVVRQNGTQVASGDASGTDSLDTIELANGDDLERRAFRGLYGEFVLYDSVLTSTEINREEQRLADKFGITI